MHPDYSVVYYPVDYHGRKKGILSPQATDALKNGGRGSVGKSGKKTIVNAMEAWHYATLLTRKYVGVKKLLSERRLAMITLTLSAPQCHTDQEIKRELLNHFLITAKRRWCVDNYIWKAELQKRGAIHFHIIVDTFVDSSELRNVWNDIQNKLGYIDIFEAKHGHRTPNSTDIKLLRNVRQAAIYARKYVAKEGDLREGFGRAWGSSDYIKLLKPKSHYFESRLEKVLLQLEEKQLVKIIPRDAITIISDKQGHFSAWVEKHLPDAHLTWVRGQASILWPQLNESGLSGFVPQPDGISGVASLPPSGGAHLAPASPRQKEYYQSHLWA